MLINTRFLSKNLRRETEVLIFLPTPQKGYLDFSLQIAKKYKVIYLLHGFGGDQKEWIYHTNVLNYAEKYNFALVMPNAYNSFYVNTDYGLNYHNFIIDELPKTLEKVFPIISTKTEEKFLAGLSMGGYGSARISLLDPESFSAVGLFSGALDIRESYQSRINYDKFYQISKQLGKFETLQANDYDLLFLLEKKLKKNEKLPKIFLSCGTKDFIYKQTLNFKEILDKYQIDYYYYEDLAKHEWSFWDKSIEHFMKFIKNK